MAYAKSTVRHRIDSLNVRNAKNASTLHAQTLVTTNSELNLVTELGTVLTVKLTVVLQWCCSKGPQSSSV